MNLEKFRYFCNINIFSYSIIEYRIYINDAKYISQIKRYYYRYNWDKFGRFILKNLRLKIVGTQTCLDEISLSFDER